MMDIKEQINFNGYYYMSHDSRKKYFNKDDYNTWCRNFTFRPKEVNGKVFMIDTFWGGSMNNDLSIEVTHDNLSLFELQADTTEVKAINENERAQYGWGNVISVITGGTGSSRVTHYVHKNLNKDVDCTISQINEKIESLNRQLQHCLDLKRQIAETGEVPKYFYI